MNDIVKVMVAIVGVAIVAVLVSQRANTANVITTAGQALGSILSAATGPVSGGVGSL